MLLIPTSKLKMSYLYRHERKEKCLTLNTLAEWIREGRYVRRVNAVRGLECIRTEVGEASGPVAAEELPRIFPSKGESLPEEPSQVSLFQQYAYKRAAEYALASTSVRPEEVRPDGTEHFRISYDPEVYLNPEAKPIEMEQPTEPHRAYPHAPAVIRGIPETPPSARVSRYGGTTWSASSSPSVSAVMTPSRNGWTTCPDGTAGTDWAS